MKQLPIVEGNTGDGAVGILQKSLVAYNVHYRKAVTRFVAVNAADHWLLFVILSHLHIICPLFVMCARRTSETSWRVTHNHGFNEKDIRENTQ